jgi:hypothetical protein
MDAKTQVSEKQLGRWHQNGTAPPYFNTLCTIQTVPLLQKRREIQGFLSRSSAWHARGQGFKSPILHWFLTVFEISGTKSGTKALTGLVFGCLLRLKFSVVSWACENHFIEPLGSAGTSKVQPGSLSG